MMTLNVTQATAKSYADIKNARYNSTKSEIRTIKQRWKESYNALSSTNKLIVDNMLEQAKDEFRRQHPTLKKWSDLHLAEAKSAIMTTVMIDGTMQRQLDIFWVLALLNKFVETKIVPIQVYRADPTKDEYLAWDGQHTLVLLWLIAEHIFGEDPSKIEVPVNIYYSHQKAEMRSTFISHNSSEGKKSLEMIDIWEQMIYGVRVDKAKNPLWIAAEEKQQYIEASGLFVTAKKFNDDAEPGAISRLQEINKLQPESVKYLSQYLCLATKLQRPVEEKEIVMMAHFFERCRYDKIKLSASYVSELARAIETVWDSDFSPQGTFWIKASIAYSNWHTASNKALKDAGFEVPAPRFKKEPVHGFPYLVAQLRKSMTRPVPKSDSNSSFIPLQSDLV